MTGQPLPTKAEGATHNFQTGFPRHRRGPPTTEACAGMSGKAVQTAEWLLWKTRVPHRGRKLAGQLDDSLDVVSLRKQIHQLHLRNAVSTRQQGSKVSS